MSESAAVIRRGSTQAAAGSSLLDAHDHTRLWLQSKLSGEWSAQAGASGLTEERLNALLRCFGTLDSMVKVRLLLAGLFVPRLERSRLQPLLGELASQAAGNQDEWVRATAAVVGDYSGTLDMRALSTQFPLVRESLMRFSSQLAELKTAPALLPQTEQYMHQDINRLPAAGLFSVGGTAARGGSASSSRGAQPHFRLRETGQAALGESAAGGGLLAGPGAGGGGGSGGPLGSGGAGGAGGLGLDSKASGPGFGGESIVRRGLGPSAAAETSVLRSRANVFPGKDPKQGPPTPSGKSAVAGPPGLALRLNRSRSSALPPDQLTIPESPHGGGTPSATSAAVATATTTTAPPAAVAAVAGAAAAGGIAAGPTAAPGGAPPGVGLAVASLPPLPPLQGQPSSGAGAGAGAGGASVGGRDSLSQHTPRGSWQGGGSGGGGGGGASAQQYPLAAAIALAAAAASGEPLRTGVLSPFHEGSTAREPPYHVQSYQHQQRDYQQDAHVLYGRRSCSQEPQGQVQDADGDHGGGELYDDDGYGVGEGRMAGRRPSQGFERVSGPAAARQWSGGDSGGGWKEGGHGAYADERGVDQRGVRTDDEEPDAKRQRAGG